MTYDETLADRIREAIGPLPGLAEIRMFGGLCFTIAGNMAIGVTGDDLMVRLEPADADAALAEPGVRPMDFTGRPMRGFLFVSPEGYATDSALRAWLDHSVAFAASLPPKLPKRPKGKRS